MCSFDELKAVQAHIESLDNADLRSAYNKQRKDFVEEVHRVGHSSFVEVYP